MKPDSQPAPDERRSHPRARASFIVTYKLVSPIPVRIRAADQNFTAVAVDIGEGGMGVVVNEDLPLGLPLQIHFALLNEQGPDREMRRWFELRAKAVHCTHRPKAGYLAGIRFEGIEPEDMQFIRQFVENRRLRPC